MNRTTRNTMISLVALALSTPVFAATKMDKLLASLDAARASLNAHRENVQTLEREIALIAQRIDGLKEKLSITGDEAVAAELEWAYADLERHQIRLADEQAAVLEWSRTVERLMVEINHLDSAESPTSDPSFGKVTSKGKVAPKAIGAPSFSVKSSKSGK